ncbi:MAG: 30S ribosomal protein S6 [Candidatus Staskawiczbacteria bacterium RIFCSPHIGHO2_12_FULL_38_11]|uniref:Small ribosomal subunit protein bS6 n=1 Tax=Candidatus Staskawiczbacteria bacterium RIFCSPHIGHO2_12_FULL_38_11 TaxID=1802209 RepID=A0A1G2I8N6_9BACT|nr:MAG: 30S ribosomal protein S6 [Candidatus Staskawiczbacteria bacterium RIFCSPHIGHO2_12_FULL_38_11]
MKTYELTYIISSQISTDESEALRKDLESFVQSKEGVILKSEKTTPQTLAYPIKKHSSGYFATLTFQVLEDKVKEIKDKLEKDLKVLRHFILIKRPVKIMKERRSKKPLFLQNKIEESPFTAAGMKKKEETVKTEDIDKKIDEILSE